MLNSMLEEWASDTICCCVMTQGHCDEADGEAGAVNGSIVPSSSQKVIFISGLASRGTTEFLEPLVRHLVLLRKEDCPLLEVCTFDNRGVGESSAPQVCPRSTCN